MANKVKKDFHVIVIFCMFFFNAEAYSNKLFIYFQYE